MYDFSITWACFGLLSPSQPRQLQSPVSILPLFVFGHAELIIERRLLCFLCCTALYFSDCSIIRGDVAAAERSDSLLLWGVTSLLRGGISGGGTVCVSKSLSGELSSPRKFSCSRTFVMFPHKMNRGIQSKSFSVTHFQFLRGEQNCDGKGGFQAVRQTSVETKS